jgi:hypothetical protein
VKTLSKLLSLVHLKTYCVIMHGLFYSCFVETRGWHERLAELSGIGGDLLCFKLATVMSSFGGISF